MAGAGTAAPASDRDAAITAWIIRLGRKLGLDVIAEGVETHERMLLPQEPGCDVVQGFYCGKPLPAAEVARFANAMVVH